MTASPPHSAERLVDLTERLRRHAHKVTGPRQAILGLLAARRGPWSSREVLAGLAGNRCNLATVYRALQLLERLGMVKRFDLGDGVARFELLRAGDDGHHHHLVCTRCAQVIELEDCFAANFEEEIAARNGFKAVTHRLEFFGLCPRCQ